METWVPTTFDGTPLERTFLPAHSLVSSRLELGIRGIVPRLGLRYAKSALDFCPHP